MTTEQTSQHKSSLKDKILDNLIALRDKYGFKNREIASKLGMNENYLSRVFNGNAEGSPQLLAGLLLLKELTELKRSGVNQELSRELEAMKQRIGEIADQISPRYPEHQPDNMALNQETAPFNSASPGETAVEVTKVAVAAGKKKLGPPPK